jgi:hypothetical protein
MREKLRVGHMLCCPLCHNWHPVVKWHTSGTEYTMQMLYFRHNGQRFYAGQEGLESRHETRAASWNRR